MHPMAARAFLAMQMSKENLEILRSIERGLPPGRYWQGSEICRWLAKNPRIPKVRNPSENEISAMESLWADYAQKQLNTGREFEESHPEVETASLAQEIHVWEDWAIRKFKTSDSVKL